MTGVDKQSENLLTKSNYRVQVKCYISNSYINKFLSNTFIKRQHEALYPIKAINQHKIINGYARGMLLQLILRNTDDFKIHKCILKRFNIFQIQRILNINYYTLLMKEILLRQNVDLLVNYSIPFLFHMCSAHFGTFTSQDNYKLHHVLFEGFFGHIALKKFVE